MRVDELCFQPVSRLSEQMARGELSPVDIVDAFLQRIGKHDEKLHAYVDVYHEEARLEAEAAEIAIRSNNAVGPFHGLPIALKDLIEMDGRITTAGSAHFRGRRSLVTASLVRRLKAHGIIILGKTHTVEFAYSGWGINQHMGTPWNPWDIATHRTPGGSSSGSGVAVAAGMAPWAIGTDTGGSVRLPASFCGLTGLKTTAGRLPVDGIFPLSSTLDTPGTITRSVLDAALLYHLLHSHGPVDPANTVELRRGLRGLRLARIPSIERHGTDQSVLEAYDRSLEVLGRLGAQIVDLQLPFRLADVFPAHMTIVDAEAYAKHHAVIDDDDSLLDESVRSGIGRGRTISALDYLSALQKRDELASAVRSALCDVDALLTPTTETAALPVASLDTKSFPSRFTRFVNTLGLCALSIPNGLNQEGLPLSLQIVCRGFEEGVALRIGHAFQEASDWHFKGPPR